MKKKGLILSISLIIIMTISSACSGETVETGTQSPEEMMAAGSTEPHAEKMETFPAEQIETLNEPVVAESQIITKKIHAVSLENNLIEENTEQGISIYLPAGYELNDRRYPVLYYLPGFGDGHFTYLMTIGDMLDKDSVDSMIVVTVNGNNKLGGSFYTNSPVTGNWEDFVTKDVISYVDENYRTIAESRGRGLAGHSMGGYGVVSIVMNNSNLFDYAYSMSPGLFDEDGFSQSPMNFKTIENRMALYEEMDSKAADSDYLSYINSIGWPTNFCFAYGSAFAYDIGVKAPYIKLPEKNGEGKYLHDEVWDLYESGYGNLKSRVDAYGENIKLLKKFVIEYGINDDFGWIPRGCNYFSELLNERGINHELVPFDGGHEDKIKKRLRENVIPFFTAAFGNFQ